MDMDMDKVSDGHGYGTVSRQVLSAVRRYPAQLPARPPPRPPEAAGVALAHDRRGQTRPPRRRRQPPLPRQVSRGWSRPRPCSLVLQKVPSELHPKVRNHGEGPY